MWFKILKPIYRVSGLREGVIGGIKETRIRCVGSDHEKES